MHLNWVQSYDFFLKLAKKTSKSQFYLRKQYK